MNEKELRQKYFSDFSGLRKILNSWNFIPDAPIDEFDSLSNKILSHLYKNSDIEKIARIISSELTITYGLYTTEFDSEKLTEEVFEWWGKLLTNYFNSDDLIAKGLPTVQSVAQTLNISAIYLNGLLKVLTGQTTQRHIHDKLIAKAKEKLSATGLSISEIAYELGFEHLQSFSKLFKTKTELSPLAFRQSFN